MTDPREEPGGLPPPSFQGLDPALDRSMNGGGGLIFRGCIFFFVYR